MKKADFHHQRLQIFSFDRFSTSEREKLHSLHVFIVFAGYFFSSSSPPLTDANMFLCKTFLKKAIEIVR